MDLRGPGQVEEEYAPALKRGFESETVKDGEDEISKPKSAYTQPGTRQRLLGHSLHTVLSPLRQRAS